MLISASPIKHDLCTLLYTFYIALIWNYFTFYVLLVYTFSRKRFQATLRLDLEGIILYSFAKTKPYTSPIYMTSLYKSQTSVYSKTVFLKESACMVLNTFIFTLKTFTLQVFLRRSITRVENKILDK